MNRNSSIERSVKKGAKYLSGLALLVETLNGVPKAEAITVDNTIEQSSGEQIEERRQAVVKEMQERIEQQNLTSKLEELRSFIGPFIQVFLKQNEISEALRLVEDLSEVSENDKVWRKKSGKAVRLEELYDQYWNVETFQERQEQPADFTIEGYNRIGFASETEANDFFTNNFLPAGWLASVDSITWLDGAYHIPFQGNATAASVPEFGNLFSSQNKRDLKFSGRIGADRDPFLLESFGLDLIYHEISHANDWDTGNYPNDFKIEFYYNVLQIVLQKMQEKGTEWEKISNYGRWRILMETWAELAEDGFQAKFSEEVDEDFFNLVIRANDSNFNPEQALVETRRKAAEIDLRHIDECIKKEAQLIEDEDDKRYFLENWQQIESEKLKDFFKDFDNLEQRLKDYRKIYKKAGEILDN